jgi:hypothetical protein
MRCSPARISPVPPQHRDRGIGHVKRDDPDIDIGDRAVTAPFGLVPAPGRPITP